MVDRSSVTVIVYQGEQYDDGFPDLCRLIDVIGWLNDLLQSIPSEFRGDAKCEIDSRSGWEGSHYATIEISYRRPETDEEMVQRHAKERARIDVRAAEEIAALKALKAKYPDVA